MKILGITLGHDSSLALIEDGEIKGMLEAERYFRQKRYKLSAERLESGPHPSGYQMVDLADLLLILDMVKEEWGGQYDAVAVQNQGRVDEYNNLLTVLRQQGFELGDAMHVDHHLSHAASVFYTSPFDKALVLSYDGEGNDGQTIFFEADGDGLRYLERNPTRFGQSYNNLGYMASISADISGSTAGKTMGLTSYGRTREEWLPAAGRYVREYEKLPRWPTEGLADKGKGHKINSLGLLDIRELKKYIKKVDYRKTKGVLKNLKQLASADEANLELHLPGLDHQDTQDLFKTVQTAWTNEVLALVEKHRGFSRNLCVVGGCALNGITNYELEKTGWFDGIHLIPNPSDCGLSAGAALYYYYAKTGKPFKGYGRYYSPYLGQEAYDKADLPRLKEQYPHRELDPKQTAGHLAALVHQDLIVGVVRGRYEVGPRALGNRSILCNPLNPDMRDILNEKVKHREWYRPFAPVVTAEDSSTYFTNEAEIPYMSVICYTRPEYADKLPSITHVDSSARVQTIAKDQNAFIHTALKEFEKLSGMPIMLNTSFNPGGEPILNFYQVAFEMLEQTGLDLLLIEDTLFAKPGQEQMLDAVDAALQAGG
ncbi:MAG: hypothetical protein KIS85_10095 [Anaerolineales bacterium]|nr:hypothetical protein [Anaerolineales bacterium]